MSEVWKGIIPPLTTPFEAGGSVSLADLEHNINSYQQLPLAGFLLLGSTGEAIHLSESEQLAVVRTAAETVSEDRSLLVGVSAPSLWQARSFLDQLAGFPVDAVLVSTPHYYRNHLSAEGWADFFSSVAEHSPFPVLLYNFPQCTGIELAVDLVSRLSQHANIGGIKDSSGNVIYLQKLLAATRGEDFQVISGSAEVMLPAWRLGVRAGIYAAACVLPEFTLRLVRAWQDDSSEAADLQSRLFEASSAIVGELGIPGIKYAMDQLGYRGGEARVPLMPLTESGRQRVESILRRTETAAATP